MSLVNPDFGLSPKTREVLDWLDARRRETERACYTSMVGVATESDKMRAARLGATPSGRAARHSGVDE